MGYASHWTGEVTITPPLTWAEIRNSTKLSDLQFRLDETVEDTDIGRTTVTTAVAIGPLDMGTYNGYHVDVELQTVINAYPSHAFEGAIKAVPEDPDGDPWRYVIRGRRVVRQVPVVEWRDDPHPG